MRPPCLLPPSAEKKLARQLDQAATKTEYRRVLCVWLRASLGMSAAEIATALGCSVGTVHNLHSQYLREGDSALAVCERGGRQCFSGEAAQLDRSVRLISEAVPLRYPIL